MTDLLPLVKKFRVYVTHLAKSTEEEQQAIATLRRIYRPNNEVSINGKKLSQSKDRLDKKLQDYAAQLRLLDKLENAIKHIEQEQEEANQ